MAASASSYAARLPRKRHVLGSSGVAASTSAPASIDLSPLRPSSLAFDEYQQQGQRHPSRQSNRSRKEEAKEEEAATSSSMSDLSSDSNDEDLESEHGHSRSRRPAQPTTANTTRKRNRHQSRVHERWTHAEDRILISSVDRWGHQWVKVKKALDRAGGPSRSRRSLRLRYRNLKVHAARQRDVASSTSTRASQPLAALLAASLDLHNRTPDQVRQPWTRKELNTLAALGPSASTLAEVFSSFLNAFPGTARTHQAVIAMWMRIRDGSKGWDGDERSEDKGHGVDGLQPVAGTSMAGNKKGSCRLEPATSASALAINGIQGRSYLASTSSSQWVGVAADSDSASLVPTLTQPHKSLRLDVTITYEPNGFRISNLPPGYGVLIHSPTQCQVLSPDELILYLGENFEQGQEEGVSSMLAPFAFRASPDGSIQALALPPGSTMGVSLVPAFETGQQFGHQERERKRASQMVESRFQGPDGYLVVFMSCLE